MSTEPAGPAPAVPAWKPLTPDQRRVLGVLIEKAKTTPAGYPLTVNAIVLGANQKNNRDPITTLTSDDVETVLAELQELGVVVESPEVTRAVKYRHRAYEWLGVNRAELAVMAELLLRGAQSLGDLRGRAARMEPIADLGALKPIVDGLVARGLMLELTAPGRGQIVSHHLYRDVEMGELRARWSGAAATASRDEAMRSSAPPSASHSPSEGLASQIAELRESIARLEDRVAALESSRGGGAIE
jgi:uncharacterized protein